MSLKRAPLEGKIIRLEPLTEKHCSPRYVSWFNDPVVCRDNRHGAGYTDEKMRAYVRRVTDSDDILAYAIIRKSDGLHVGNVALNAISSENRSAEISILIGDRSAWGGGIGTEVCRLLLDYAFNTLQLHRVWMGMMRRNEAMSRIAQKLGMEIEGILRDTFFKDGKYHDLIQWAALNPRDEASHAPRIVVLMRYGNAAGLEYLQAFREAGIALRAIVFEGDSFFPKDRLILQERTAGKYKPLFLGDALPVKIPPLYFMRDHNSDECEQLLYLLRPDALVLGGTSILSPRILKTAAWGSLNCHPGRLPDYRGSCCVEWSIFHDDPVGATCHLVSEKIDSGPIVYYEDMPIYKSDNYADIRARMFGHQRKIMLEGLRRFLARPQGWSFENLPKGVYRRVIHPDAMRMVLEKIDKKTYKQMKPA